MQRFSESKQKTSIQQADNSSRPSQEKELSTIFVKNNASLQLDMYMYIPPKKYEFLRQLRVFINTVEYELLDFVFPGCHKFEFKINTMKLLEEFLLQAELRSQVAHANFQELPEQFQTQVQARFEALMKFDPDISNTIDWLKEFGIGDELADDPVSNGVRVLEAAREWCKQQQQK